MDLAKLFRVDGHVALVTGAGRGIGLSLAHAFAAAGARVAIQDIDQDIAEREAAALRADGFKAVALGGDATVLADVERWLPDAKAALGGDVDILVNNASIQGQHPFDEWTLDEASRILDANLLHIWRLSQLAVPAMRAKRWGRILNIGSIQGVRGSFGMSPYSISKGGLHHLTRTLAPGLGRDGITVNCIAPGLVDTIRNAEWLEHGGRDEATKWVPLGRVSVGDDHVGAALMFCSDAGAYITGTVLSVDGGMHVR